MNGYHSTLIYSIIAVQHLLNKPLDKRGTNKRVLFLSQQLFSIVEKLLRVYIISYQHSHILIHQFNKRRMVLQGFKLFPCDGVETTDSFYRLISTLPIIVELVGGIGQPVGYRCELPALLQDFPDLVLFYFYLRVY